MTETRKKELLDDVFAFWDQYCADQVDFVNRELRKKKGDGDGNNT